MYQPMAIMQSVKKTIYFFKRNGFKKTVSAVRERLNPKGKVSYQYAFPEEKELKKQRAMFSEAEKEKYPLISIAVPLYETPEDFLKDLLDSVRTQTYPFFELLLGDFSEDNKLEKLISAYGEERFVYHYFGNNQGISDNTNLVLTMAKGSYIGLLDHDDVLTEDALYEVYKGIREEEKQGLKPMLLYSDEDKWTGKRGDYYSLHEKEPFNQELLYSYNYICHFCVLESNLMKRLGFRGEYTGAQDYDLALRAVTEIKKNKEQSIHYINRVLYHWRCHKNSTAENPVSKTYAYEAGRLALEDLFRQEGKSIRAEHREYVGLYRLIYDKPYFQTFREVAILGGRVLKDGCLAGGRLSEEGFVYYEGMKADYTGYFHKAVLPQDAYAVDLRCMKLNPQCKDVFSQVTGEEYKEDDCGRCCNFRNLSEEEGRAVSLKLCESLRELGYRIVWHPDQVPDLNLNKGR